MRNWKNSLIQNLQNIKKKKNQKKRKKKKKDPSRGEIIWGLLMNGEKREKFAYAEKLKKELLAEFYLLHAKAMDQVPHKPEKRIILEKIIESIMWFRLLLDAEMTENFEPQIKKVEVVKDGIGSQTKPN